MIEKYGKSTKAPMKRSIDKTVQIESALQTKDIISGPIQIDISDPWTIEKIWNENPSSGLPDPSLLQVMIDQLRDQLPAKVREITGNLQIDQLKLPLTITFGQILPAGDFIDH